VAAEDKTLEEMVSDLAQEHGIPEEKIWAVIEKAVQEAINRNPHYL